MPREPLRLRTGQKLGRYDLLTPVARGGMGQVWAARLCGARGFHKLVAIKTLLPADAALDSALLEQRLLDQARIAALIQHSNVVQTLELGEHAGQLYLVTEWVDGESLGDLIECAEQVGGVPLLIAVNLVAQALRGLQAAHELKDDAGRSLGIAHKDLSPHNLLVSYSGTVKIVDFGIAKAMNQCRVSGEVAGKGGYEPPEQISGGVVDQRGDVFALGVILYQLTTGRHPFHGQGTDTRGVARNIVSDEPALRPSLLKPNYSRTLEAVVLKALEKEQDRRWPSAEEMRLALQRGVPQAFELGFESQLRAFMSGTVGDRALRKREALRRAELVVDAGGADEGSGASSISATSLRAIAIDTNPGRTDSLPPRASPFGTLRPLLARSVPPPHLRRPLLVAFSALAAVVCALLWLRAPGRSVITAATAPGSGMVDLTPPRAPSPAPLTVVHTPVASASPGVSAAPVASVSASSASHATPSRVLRPKR